MLDTSKSIKVITYGVFQSGWAAKDEVLHAPEEGGSILGPGLEISGRVELFDMLIKVLVGNLLTT